MAPKKKPISERFWSKVSKSEGCWLWTGARLPRGYGKIGRDCGGWDLAHRVSWELHFGAITDGLHVLHKCDNPPCVNPAHLFLGTRSDNMQDCFRKLRGFHCVFNRDSHPMAKLSSDDVAEIRRLAPTKMRVELAAQFNVSVGLISQIVLRRIWK